MNTFGIIAIPFFILSLVMVALALKHKNNAFWITGGVFMASTVVNAILGIALRSELS